jgi:DNA-directed RNA polymerase II subunit RPB3
VVPVKFSSITGEDKGILICVLATNQELELECEARKGIAKFHSKWSPVSVANFTHEAVITFKEQLNEMDMNKKLQFVNSCPQNVFQINKKTNKIELSPNGLNNCNFCGDCLRKVDNMGMDSE